MAPKSVPKPSSGSSRGKSSSSASRPASAASSKHAAASKKSSGSSGSRRPDSARSDASNKHSPKAAPSSGRDSSSRKKKKAASKKKKEEAAIKAAQDEVTRVLADVLKKYKYQYLRIPVLFRGRDHAPTALPPWTAPSEMPILTLELNHASFLDGAKRRSWSELVTHLAKSVAPNYTSRAVMHLLQIDPTNGPKGHLRLVGMADIKRWEDLDRLISYEKSIFDVHALDSIRDRSTLFEGASVEHFDDKAPPVVLYVSTVHNRTDMDDTFEEPSKEWLASQKVGAPQLVMTLASAEPGAKGGKRGKRGRQSLGGKKGGAGSGTGTASSAASVESRLCSMELRSYFDAYLQSSKQLHVREGMVRPGGHMINTLEREAFYQQAAESQLAAQPANTQLLQLFAKSKAVFMIQPMRQRAPPAAAAPAGPLPAAPAVAAAAAADAAAPSGAVAAAAAPAVGSIHPSEKVVPVASAAELAASTEASLRALVQVQMGPTAYAATENPGSSLSLHAEADAASSGAGAVHKGAATASSPRSSSPHSPPPAAAAAAAQPSPPVPLPTDPPADWEPVPDVHGSGFFASPVHLVTVFHNLYFYNEPSKRGGTAWHAFGRDGHGLAWYRVTIHDGRHFHICDAPGTLIYPASSTRASIGYDVVLADVTGRAPADLGILPWQFIRIDEPAPALLVPYHEISLNQQAVYVMGVSGGRDTLSYSLDGTARQEVAALNAPVDLQEPPLVRDGLLQRARQRSNGHLSFCTHKPICTSVVAMTSAEVASRLPQDAAVPALRWAKFCTVGDGGCMFYSLSLALDVAGVDLKQSIADGLLTALSKELTDMGPLDIAMCAAFIKERNLEDTATQSTISAEVNLYYETLHLPGTRGGIFELHVLGMLPRFQRYRFWILQGLLDAHPNVSDVALLEPDKHTPRVDPCSALRTHDVLLHWCSFGGGSMPDHYELIAPYEVDAQGAVSDVHWNSQAMLNLQQASRKNEAIALAKSLDAAASQAQPVPATASAVATECKIPDNLKRSSPQIRPGNVLPVTVSMRDSSISGFWQWEVLYSSQTWPGMSGGPVLLADGRLVAIHRREGPRMRDSDEDKFGKRRFAAFSAGVRIDLWRKDEFQVGYNGGDAPSQPPLAAAVDPNAAVLGADVVDFLSPSGPTVAPAAPAQPAPGAVPSSPRRTAWEAIRRESNKLPAHSWINENESEASSSVSDVQPPTSLVDSASTVSSQRAFDQLVDALKSVKPLMQRLTATT